MNKMGQGEVLKVLEERGCLSEREIAEILNVQVASVCDVLHKLVKYDEVEREERIKKTSQNNSCKYYVFRIKVETKKKEA